MEKLTKQKYDWVCYICERHYASQSSLCNHNRSFHKNKNVTECYSNVIGNVTGNVTECYSNVIDSNSKFENISLRCEYCKKIFSFRSGKSAHKKICKERIKQEEIEIEKEKQLTIINKTNINNGHNKTINNQNNIKNNIQNNNIQNNNIQNNYITYNFNSEQDRERVPVILNNEEKLKLLLEPFHNYIPKLVETIYCGKYIQFRNVVIKNLKDKYLYIFNDGKFVAEKRDLVLNTLVENNYWNIENIADDLEMNKELDIRDTLKRKIKNSRTRFNEMYESKDSYYNNEIKYKNFKEYNKEKITLLLFNNRDKIKDKCALLSGEKLTEKEIEYMVEMKKLMEEGIDEEEEDNTENEEEDAEESEEEEEEEEDNEEVLTKKNSYI